ncbi:hypothetical protein Droror1_Dr00001434 [Drosera rotundifolia]
MEYGGRTEDGDGVESAATATREVSERSESDKKMVRLGGSYFRHLINGCFGNGQSSAGWQRANDIHEDNQRFAQTKQKLGILNERIVMETNIAKAEKELYDLDPIAMGSPSDKARRVVEMKNMLVALRALADELIANSDLSSSTTTSRGGIALNLESRAYAGHKKYITPNKREMLPYFMNSSLPEAEFNRTVKKLHQGLVH